MWPTKCLFFIFDMSFSIKHLTQTAVVNAHHWNNTILLSWLVSDYSTFSFPAPTYIPCGDSHLSQLTPGMPPWSNRQLFVLGWGGVKPLSGLLLIGRRRLVLWGRGYSSATTVVGLTYCLFFRPQWCRTFFNNTASVVFFSTEQATAEATSALKQTAQPLHRLIADLTVFGLLTGCINDFLSTGSSFESLLHRSRTACLFM